MSAALPRSRESAAAAPAPLERIRTVLVRTSHPGNIGAAARALWTMGLDTLVLVEPKRFPDAEASARATGAEALLERAQVASSLSDALAGCAWSLGLSARPRDLRRPRAADARGGG